MRIGRSGFSAIELVVVVSIVAMLLAWSYPRLATLSSQYRLDGAAWNVATVLQKTRLRAIGETTRFRIVFDTTQRTYQIQKDVSGTFTNDGAAQAIDDAGAIGVSATASPIYTTRGVLETGTASVVTLTSQTAGARLVSAQLGGRVVVQ